MGREEGVCGGKGEYGGDGDQMLGGGMNEYPHMLSSLLPQRDDRIWEEGIRMLRGGACEYGEDASDIKDWEKVFLNLWRRKIISSRREVRDRV